jgi:hypothetical protein
MRFVQLVRTTTACLAAACGCSTIEFPTATASRHGPVAGAAREAAGVDRTAGCRLRYRRFRTLPELRPVGMCMLRERGAKPAPGHIFVSPRPPDERGGRQYGLMIVSDQGQLLWYARRSNVVHDLKPVHYRGQRLLAFYHRMPRRDDSHYELLDDRYRLVRRITAGNGMRVNGHELQLTERGTAYLSIYRRMTLPGSGRRVTEYVIQEIDLVTGDVLFEWHSLDHVPLSASYDPPPTDGSHWDYFHGNSIEPPTPRGRTIIVSARKTSAVYGIDRKTGELLWVLGGKDDDFGLVKRNPAWQFCAQHDARRLPNGDLTVFDNGGAGLGNGRDCPVHAARVARYRLDTSRMTARLVGSISSKPSSANGAGYFPTAVGSARRQGNGGTLVSWGTTGQVTETARSGRVKLRLALRHWTYRAVRAPWTGRPPGCPAVLARRGAGGAVKLWASWNGATEIRQWRVLAGETPSELRPVGSPFAFADLETKMRIRTRAEHAAVQAVDSSGAVIGQSATVRIQPARE